MHRRRTLASGSIRSSVPGIANLFMRPYNTKVWARPPERLAWHWIGDRVATVDVSRVIENIRLGRDDVSWGPNNRFRFPRRGGTGAIWRALSDRLRCAPPQSHPYEPPCGPTRHGAARRRISVTGPACATSGFSQPCRSTCSHELSDLKRRLGSRASRSRIQLDECDRRRLVGTAARAAEDQELDVFSREQLSVLPGDALLALRSGERL